MPEIRTRYFKKNKKKKSQKISKIEKAWIEFLEVKNKNVAKPEISFNLSFDNYVLKYKECKFIKNEKWKKDEIFVPKKLPLYVVSLEKKKNCKEAKSRPSFLFYFTFILFICRVHRRWLSQGTEGGEKETKIHFERKLLHDKRALTRCNAFFAAMAEIPRNFFLFFFFCSLFYRV